MVALMSTVNSRVSGLKRLSRVVLGWCTFVPSLLLETIAEHFLSPRWSQYVESHVQTSIKPVRVIARLLLIARRHAGKAYMTRS